jgi:hypothetical protein
MQPELRLELTKEGEAALVQADPDHVTRSAGPLPSFVSRDVGHSPPPR